MALVLKDRVKETTTTTGTGTVTLAGAATGYQAFSAIGDANTTYYCISGGSEWEVGIGTYTSSGTTLSRDTILASSNSGSAVNFSAGTKAVFVVYPAGKSVNQDASGNVGIGTSSPSVKLDVVGSITASSTTGLPVILVTSNQAAGFAPPNIQMLRGGVGGAATPDNQTLGQIRFDCLSVGATYDNAAFIQVSSGVNAAGGMPASMIFGTAASGANATERMRIDSSGNISFTGATIMQNSQSAAYTLVAADANKHILHPSADTTARTFTIPANSSVAYSIGTALTFVNQNGAGVVTIAINTDTMRLAGAGTTGSRTLDANGIATALKITATEWIISGTGLT
jgi:hypothetical protein